MDVIVERPAALDVHKEQVTACVRFPAPDGSRAHEVRQFKTTVGGLLVLRDWLKAHGVTHVAMEATGVYWKPVWAILEDDFELLLVNAREVKNLPGRKTDVKDAEWLCQLLEAGLLRASFVPPKPIRELREFTRYRAAQIKERQREANRLHKALEPSGIKLDCVATDILGKSGRDMLDALCSGTTDPEVLAELARGKLRKKIPQLKEALQGRFDARRALLIGAILAHLDFLDEQIERLSDAIEEQLRPFQPAVELLRSLGGIETRTAQNIIAEIGPDMSIFPTAGHLASWAKQCPGNNQSAGKRKSGRTPKGPKWLDDALKNAAMAASAPTTATCKPNTSGSSRDSATDARWAPSSTQSSARSGTCSPPASCTTTSAATTSANATPNARPTGSSPSSNASATKSPSNPSRRPHDQP